MPKEREEKWQQARTTCKEWEEEPLKDSKKHRESRSLILSIKVFLVSHRLHPHTTSLKDRAHAFTSHSLELRDLAEGWGRLFLLNTTKRAFLRKYSLSLHFQMSEVVFTSFYPPLRFGGVLVKVA